MRITTPPPSTTARILLVDDDPMIHSLVSTILTPTGALVVPALNALDGLALASADPPDLILLDHDLPDRSGTDVLRQMSQDPALASIATIVVTASESRQVLSACFLAGAVDYVRKPFTSVELRARVRMVLERQRLLRHVAELSGRDALTGLPAHGAWVNGELSASVALSRTQSGMDFALLVVNLDRFSDINARFGSDVGDQLLVEIAQRIRRVVRTPDGPVARTDVATVARLGGDEFGVMLPGVSSAPAAGAVAERILGAIAEPFEHDAAELTCTASIGAAQQLGQYLTSRALVRDASIAMRASKMRGVGTCTVFTKAMVGMEQVRWGAGSGTRQSV